MLVSGSSDNTVKVWHLKTGEEINTLRGHSSSVISVALSRDGKPIASCSSDKTIKVWHVLS
jgi:WD40 repeat protein